MGRRPCFSSQFWRMEPGIPVDAQTGRQGVGGLGMGVGDVGIGVEDVSVGGDVGIDVDMGVGDVGIGVGMWV